MSVNVAEKVPLFSIPKIKLNKYDHFRYVRMANIKQQGACTKILMLLWNASWTMQRRACIARARVISTNAESCANQVFPALIFNVLFFIVFNCHMQSDAKCSFYSLIYRKMCSFFICRYSIMILFPFELLNAMVNEEHFIMALFHRCISSSRSNETTMWEWTKNRHRARAHASFFSHTQTHQSHFHSAGLCFSTN